MVQNLASYLSSSWENTLANVAAPFTWSCLGNLALVSHSSLAATKLLHKPASFLTQLQRQLLTATYCAYWKRQPGNRETFLLWNFSLPFLVPARGLRPRAYGVCPCLESRVHGFDTSSPSLNLSWGSSLVYSS